MAKIDENSIAKLKALFQDNEKALGSNFSQLIDFFNDNKVTDNGDGTFSVGNTIINVNDIVQEPEIRSLILSQLKASTDLVIKEQLDTKADDSKVVHDTGNEEIGGQKTFDMAPIDKTTGNPYITKSGVPTVDLSSYATNSQLATKADDSKVVHTKDMRKPASDVAGIEEVSTLQTQVNNSAVGTNLIAQSGVTQGYIRKSDGIVVPFSGNDFHSDNYIATNGETVFTLSSPDYVFKGSSNHTMAMYDSDKKYLGYQNITSSTCTLSEPNAVYIRFSIHFIDEGGTYNNLSDWLDNHRYKLEKGNVATDWCPNPSEILTQADDSKVAHLSGANNFNTVPTVNNNPLLLASSLPSDLARTGFDQEFTGKNTFDTAPIDKTTGNPYITKSDLPAVVTDKDAVINVVTQAQYDSLADKSGLYVIKG